MATLTEEQWIKRHIDNLTGVDQNTIDKYKAYLRNDIAGPLGALPLSGLTQEHIIQWVKCMQEPDAKGWKPSSKTTRPARNENSPDQSCRWISLPSKANNLDTALLTSGKGPKAG